MARQHKDLFPAIASFRALHEAAEQAIRGKRGKPGAAAFMANREKELLRLERRLIDNCNFSVRIRDSLPVTTMHHLPPAGLLRSMSPNRAAPPAGQSLTGAWAWCAGVLLLLMAVVLLLPTHAHAARVALVIGNAAYPERPLKNPTNDAEDLASALSSAGFKVTLKKNLNADAMKEAISEFGDALRREGDTGLFYFSGHGVQTPKGNYLLPTGRSFKRTKDVELFAVEARAVLSEMQQARNPLNILILDACRDSPLPAEERGEGSNKGLARMDAPSGSVIAFATAPGRTASDNSTGRNGLYTKHLVSAINTPGLRLEDVFKRAGAAVEKESQLQGGDQSPEEVMKLRSEQPFYFKAASSHSGNQSVTRTMKRVADFSEGPLVMYSDGTLNMALDYRTTAQMLKTCLEGAEYIDRKCRGDAKLYSFAEALQIVNQANQAAYAGYSNWRIPRSSDFEEYLKMAGEMKMTEKDHFATTMFHAGYASFQSWLLPSKGKWESPDDNIVVGGFRLNRDGRYRLRLIRSLE